MKWLGEGAGARRNAQVAEQWKLTCYVDRDEKAHRRLSETTGWLRQLRKWNEDFRKNNVWRLKIIKGITMSTRKVMGTTVKCPLTTPTSPSIISVYDENLNSRETCLSLCLYYIFRYLFLSVVLGDAATDDITIHLCDGAQSFPINDTQSNLI